MTSVDQVLDPVIFIGARLFRTWLHMQKLCYKQHIVSNICLPYLDLHKNCIAFVCWYWRVSVHAYQIYLLRMLFDLAFKWLAYETYVSSYTTCVIKSRNPEAPIFSEKYTLENKILPRRTAYMYYCLPFTRCWIKVLPIKRRRWIFRVTVKELVEREQ